MLASATRITVSEQAVGRRSPPRGEAPSAPATRPLFDVQGRLICDVRCATLGDGLGWELVPLDPGRLLDFYFMQEGRLVALDALSSTERGRLVTGWRGDRRQWRIERC
jgi:hypothetical protein